MSAIKEFFMEIIMWWIDWLADGQVGDMILRFIMTLLFLGMIGFAVYYYIFMN